MASKPAHLLLGYTGTLCPNDLSLNPGTVQASGPHLQWATPPVCSIWDKEDGAWTFGQ